MEGLTSKPIPFRKERLKTAAPVIRVPGRIIPAQCVAVQGETVIPLMAFKRHKRAA